MVSHLVAVVGLCAPMTQKISKIWRVGANYELTKPVRADLLHVTSAFVLISASQLTTALQPSIYGFTAVYSFIAVICNLVVKFGDAHWAKLIWSQHWAV